MSDHGYEIFDDPYCYQGTFVLKNKGGLRDPAKPEAFELEMTSLRAEEPLPVGRFGPAHYRAVHGPARRFFMRYAAGDLPKLLRGEGLA